MGQFHLCQFLVATYAPLTLKYVAAYFSETTDLSPSADFLHSHSCSIVKLKLKCPKHTASHHRMHVQVFHLI